MLKARKTYKGASSSQPARPDAELCLFRGQQCLNANDLMFKLPATPTDVCCHPVVEKVTTQILDLLISWPLLVLCVIVWIWLLQFIYPNKTLQLVLKPCDPSPYWPPFTSRPPFEFMSSALNHLCVYASVCYVCLCQQQNIIWGMNA